MEVNDGSQIARFEWACPVPIGVWSPTPGATTSAPQLRTWLSQHRYHAVRGSGILALALYGSSGKRDCLREQRQQVPSAALTLQRRFSSGLARTASYAVPCRAKAYHVVEVGRGLSGRGAITLGALAPLE
ncbi:MAG: hypothetical protein H6715_04580 [Myxococcales bacterium]|nr:hypothetical protein [Myxococcales bacterium]